MTAPTAKQLKEAQDALTLAEHNNAFGKGQAADNEIGALQKTIDTATATKATNDKAADDFVKAVNALTSRSNQTALKSAYNKYPTNVAADDTKVAAAKETLDGYQKTLADTAAKNVYNTANFSYAASSQKLTWTAWTDQAKELAVTIGGRKQTVRATTDNLTATKGAAIEVVVTKKINGVDGTFTANFSAQ